MTEITRGTLPDLPLHAARLVMSCPSTFAPDSPLKVRNEALVNDWLVWLRDVAGRSPGTVRNYAGVAVRYLAECVGERPLDGVSAEDVERWTLRVRGGRAKGRVGAPATRARNIAVLKSMYKWLHARGLVTLDVGALLVAPKVNNRLPRAINDQLWFSIWPHATRDSRQVAMILGLGFFYGLRRSEIAGLRGRNIDGPSGRIVNFVRKGGGEDTFPAAEIDQVWHHKKPELVAPWGQHDLWGALVGRAAQVGPDGLLAGLDGSGPYGGADLVNKRLTAFLGRIGAPGAFTPHSLRHSFVTNLLRCGMPIEMVSELANHSDIGVTMRYRSGGGGMVTEWLGS